MDNITHSLVGALIGQAGLKKRTGLAMPALIIGANLPDVDAACFFWLDGVEHLGFRRGITHGPPAMVLLPLILAGVLWVFDRWQTKRGTRPEGRLPVSFKWLYLLSFIACLTHPALDWLNVYGIRLLEPFSHRWFYGDTLFIIDVWLWALLGFATWFSLRRERAGGNWMKPARIAIAVALAYIGMNWAISFIAVQTSLRAASAQREVIASPVPVTFWRREMIEFSPSDTQLFVYPEIWHWSLTNGPEDAPQFLVADDLPFPCLDRSAYDGDREAHAFIFWSRVPIVDYRDGRYLLRDARFYHPLSRDRFSVALPNVKCEPLAND